ncbi:hypothetical protein [Microvirga rosea]|uniref:hypothetical protein n=1 Tax=Microvirga rosea TaxID=2715425 RepID=UPI001D0A6688|nr:hypothetical protein [Microvirga rosea]MCB8822456.1 hypothetical protein [Microvirga rosea]
MAEVSWIAAGLLLMLPADMTLVNQSRERIPVLGLNPPVMGHADEVFCSWSDPQGREFHLFWWNSLQPPVPKGPASFTEEWNGMIGDRKVRVARTDMFMGQKQEVLATWLTLEERQSSAMMFARGASRQAFEQILKASQIAEARPASAMSCEPASPRLQ